MADKELILNVKSNIKDAADDAEKLGDNLEDAGKKGKKGFQGIGKAVKGVGNALKAAGIGIVVALLAKLMDVFRQNQKVLDFFNIAMETLSIAFNDLFGFLENNIGAITGFFKDIFENPTQSIKDFGKAIKDNLIERFESLLDTFGHLGKALGHLFKGEFAEALGSVKDAGKESIDVLTGVNNTVDKTKDVINKTTDVIVNYTKEVVKNAKATVELRKSSELARVQVQGLIEDYDRQAEKLRQVRDDETKTFAERIEANKELGRVLEEQGVEMQKLVDIQVNAAQVEFDKNQSQENLIALTEALNEKKAVEAQITGFQSEQLTNQVALEKELLEAKNEVLASGLSGIELELAELEASYKLKLDMARKAGMETTALEKQFAKQKADIVREQTNAQLEAFSGLAGALQSLAGESKELAIAQAIIDTYVGANKAFAQGGTVGFITGAAVIAQGLANVKTIMQQDVGSGSGGGGASTPTAAPRTELTGGAFTLEGGVEPEPARAFVVSDDITDSQNKLANIRRRATI
tara:strand:- start:5681 stop:7249 length:1569 start_codon:yes stop_codon:yes gene_type:complete